MSSISIYNKIFILFVATLIVSISLIGWFGFKNTSDAYTDLAYDTSRQNTNLLKTSIESKLMHVPKDVIFTTNFYALQNFLTWRSMEEEIKESKWKEVLSDTLLDFFRTKQYYYKARIIDLEGDEIINVRYNNVLQKSFVTKDSALENKSGRDYVEKTKLLKKGEFYLSPMNLNIESEIIQKPFVPVVRYSTPIIGTNREVIAVFVISIYAQDILNIIEKQSTLDEDKGLKYYLLDKKGNYLYHENELKRWNSQLKHGYTFNEEHFDVKEYFKNKKSGSFTKNGKIYSFHQVHPLKKNLNDYWYIVSSVDENIALSKLDSFKSIFIISIFLIITFSFFIVRFFIRIITNPLSLVTSQLTALSRGEIKKEEIDYTDDDEVGKLIKSTQRVIDAIEKTTHQANLVASGDLSQEIELLGKNDHLGLAINKMTSRLKEIEALAINLSHGNYQTNIVSKGSSDKLGIALLEMITYLNTVTKVAESISKGEIETQYISVGTDDRLGIAMLKMIAYLKTILHQANAISKEDFSQTIEAKSKSDELGIAMATMTSILSSSYIKNKNETYFSEGIGEFTYKLTRIKTTEDLAEIAIFMTTRYVGATTGIVYAYDEEKHCLDMSASFAFSRQTNMPTTFILGEGVVGQVGLEKKHILLKNIKQNTYEIRSGSTLGTPKEVFVFPLVHDESLFGVIEIMSYEKFTKIKIDYLLKAAGILATALHLAGQNARIKTLLKKSRADFEELQIQSEELQESNVHMEEQQQQLTLQSTELRGKNERLASAKEEIDRRADDLAKASQYKSEFLANMSHELRTPLNSIILLSTLLSKNKDRNLNEKDIEKANVINKSGNDLLFLINDILDLTKIESGNMELHIDKVYSKDILDEMKGLFKDLTHEKNIDFIVEDNFNDGFMADRSKLQQILKNLLSNSIKFTSKGYVGIYMREDKGKIELVVKDTGIGIDEGKLETIFESFKQVDGSISREYGGTGLGLSISKTIVDLMSGTIKVESELGKGSSFIVSFPLVKIEGPQGLKDNFLDSSLIIMKGNPKDTKFTNDSIEKNILIVDDDSRNIFTLTSTLESVGAEVYSAFNGQEAMEILQKNEVRVDLILMDIMMPVMDGIVAIKNIKADEKYKKIPIIAITAKNTSEDKQKCLDAGADGYLAKPLEENALFSMIKDMDALNA